MTDIVLLNNVAHHDLKIVPEAALAPPANQGIVFPNEFEAIQRDYPILLRMGGGDAPHAVALMGLDRDENLYRDGGGWQARYIPAHQQLGPFRIGMTPSEGDGAAEPMLYCDLDHPAVGRTQGQPLFREHGGNAPYLDHMIGVLRTIHVGRELVAPFFAALAEHDLIEPVTLRINLDETTRYDVPDAHTVSSERLAALDGAALEALNRAGVLRPAIMVAASLANVARLIELKNARRARKAA